MTDDILIRLRKAVCYCNDYDGLCLQCEAANAIERLSKDLLLAEAERDYAQTSLRDVRKTLINALWELATTKSLLEKGTQK